MNIIEAKDKLAKLYPDSHIMLRFIVSYFGSVDKRERIELEAYIDTLEEAIRGKTWGNIIEQIKIRIKDKDQIAAPDQCD